MRDAIRRSIVLAFALALPLAGFLIFYPDAFRTGSLTRADGTALRLSAWDIGWVDVIESEAGRPHLVGWAADREGRLPAELVVVFLDGREIASGRPGLPRPDVVASTGSRDLLHSGFRIALPMQWDEARAGDVRAYAVLSRGTAGELRYGDGFRGAAR